MMNQPPHCCQHFQALTNSPLTVLYSTTWHLSTGISTLFILSFLVHSRPQCPSLTAQPPELKLNILENRDNSDAWFWKTKCRICNLSSLSDILEKFLTEIIVALDAILSCVFILSFDYELRTDVKCNEESKDDFGRVNHP